MSDITKAVAEILRGVAGLEGKAHANSLPQDIEAPAATYALTTSGVEEVLDGTIMLEEAAIQVETYGRTMSEAVQLWRAVRSAMLGSARRTVADCLIREVSRNGGRYDIEERAQDGTDERRFVTVQDYRLFYCS